jgi:hypothetical protein
MRVAFKTYEFRVWIFYISKSDSEYSFNTLLLAANFDLDIGDLMFESSTK